jgi:hypothetical protein
MLRRMIQAPPASIDSNSLKPVETRHLLHPAFEFAMIMGALASTRGSWDDRSWAAKTWQDAGAITPVQIPAQVPPTWGMRR